MERHLEKARLELRRALEEHPGSNELDQLTRLILEAVRAIAAAQREALRGDWDGDHRSELKVVRSFPTESDRTAGRGACP